MSSSWEQAAQEKGGPCLQVYWWCVRAYPWEMNDKNEPRWREWLLMSWFSCLPRTPPNKLHLPVLSEGWPHYPLISNPCRCGSSIHLPMVFQVWISTSTAWIFSVLHPSVLRQRNLKSVAGRCELDAQHLYGKHWGPGLMSDLKTEC